MDTGHAKVLFAEIHNHLAEIDERLQKLAVAASAKGDVEMEASLLPIRKKVEDGQITHSKLEVLIFDGRRI